MGPILVVIEPTPLFVLVLETGGKPSL